MMNKKNDDLFDELLNDPYITNYGLENITTIKTRLEKLISNLQEIVKVMEQLAEDEKSKRYKETLKTIQKAFQTAMNI